MKRRLLVTPRARRDVNAIIDWYRTERGAASAAKVARTLQAGLRARQRINEKAARRPDLPEGYYRVVARSHLIIFQIEGDISKVVRVVHGARDLPTLLERPE